MLVKNVRGFESSSTFLSRRGWPTKVSNNLQKAVKIISTEKPDFVLISVNFPHPSITKLGPLFAHTFKVQVVWFSESMDASSQANLSKIKGAKITGGASGPNLQRSLRRILQEKFNPSQALEKNTEDYGNSETQSQTTTVKGDSTKKDNSFTMTQSQTTYDRVDSGNYSMESQVLSTKRKKLKDLDPISSIAGMPESEVLNDDAELELHKMLTGMLGSDLSPNESSDAAASSTEQDDSDPLSKSPKVSSLDISTKQIQKASDLKSAASSQEQNSFDNSFEKELDENDLGLFDLQKQREAKNNKLSSLESNQKSNYKPLFKAVSEAVMQLTSSVQKVASTEVDSGELYVMPIDNPEMHGYLILKIDLEGRSEAKELKQSLFDVISKTVAEKASIRVEMGFDLNVTKNNFCQWAESTATFALQSDYQGYQFAVAFFPSEKPLPKLKASKLKGMLDVSIFDISTSHPVNFKGYLKLEKNKKLLLYLKNNRFFLKEQKERLKSKKVETVFVKEIEETNLRKFFAFVWIEDSISKLLQEAS